VMTELADAVLTGHLDGADLARAVASADILIHPSRTEAFGNVVLEAMASSLAIVSADTDSARALIEHGRSGLLCPPGAIDGFASEVAHLASDRARRRELGREARSASTAFSWDEALNTALNAYRIAVLTNASAARR
jgi:phosphatidylinositol alpha 1,6-mannosyltransferase